MRGKFKIKCRSTWKGQKGWECDRQRENMGMQRKNPERKTDKTCLPSYPHTASLKGSGVSGARGRQRRSIEEKHETVSLEIVLMLEEKRPL